MPIVFQDTFTETSDTALGSHTPNPTGTSWTQLEKSGSPDLRVSGANDRVEATVAGNSQRVSYTADATYDSADYDVEVTVAAKPSAGSDDPAALLARIADSSNFYALQFYHSAGSPRFRLFKKVAGAFTELATESTTTLAAGDSLKLELRGTAIKGYINQGSGYTEILSATDSSLTGAGKAGLGLGNLYNTSPGDIDDVVTAWGLDAFIVTTVASGSTYNVALALAIQGALTGTAALTLSPAVALVALGGVSDGGALTALPTLTLAQVLSLLASGGLAYSQQLQLGVQAGQSQGVATVVNRSLTLATGSGLAPYAALVRAGTIVCATQAALSASNLRTIAPGLSLSVQAALTVVIESLNQINLSLSLAAQAGYAPLRQLHALGSITMGIQAAQATASTLLRPILLSLGVGAGLAQSGQRTSLHNVAISAQVTLSQLLDFAKEVAIALSSQASLSTSAIKSHAATIALQIQASITEQSQAVYQSLVTLGVQSHQAQSVTRVIQALLTLQMQALLSAAASTLGPDVAKLILFINESLTFTDAIIDGGLTLTDAIDESLTFTGAINKLFKP